MDSKHFVSACKKVYLHETAREYQPFAVVNNSTHSHSTRRGIGDIVDEVYLPLQLLGTNGIIFLMQQYFRFLCPCILLEQYHFLCTGIEVDVKLVRLDNLRKHITGFDNVSGQYQRLSDLAVDAGLDITVLQVELCPLQCRFICLYCHFKLLERGSKLIEFLARCQLLPDQRRIAFHIGFGQCVRGFVLLQYGIFLVPYRLVFALVYSKKKGILFNLLPRFEMVRFQLPRNTADDIDLIDRLRFPGKVYPYGVILFFEGMHLDRCRRYIEPVSDYRTLCCIRQAAVR